MNDAFDRMEELHGLPRVEANQLRAIVLDHDNDPIAQMSFRMAVKRPAWLASDTRGRGVPERMEWVPLISFVQVMVDAMNAMRVIPGQFKSFGHDYRGDTAAFVHEAYRFDPVTDEQMNQVVDVLLELEVERGTRIGNAKDGSHDDAPADMT